MVRKIYERGHVIRLKQRPNTTATTNPSTHNINNITECNMFHVLLTTY